MATALQGTAHGQPALRKVSHLPVSLAKTLRRQGFFPTDFRHPLRALRLCEMSSPPHFSRQDAKTPRISSIRSWGTFSARPCLMR